MNLDKSSLLRDPGNWFFLCTHFYFQLWLICSNQSLMFPGYLYSTSEGHSITPTVFISKIHLHIFTYTQVRCHNTSMNGRLQREERNGKYEFSLYKNIIFFTLLLAPPKFRWYCVLTWGRHLSLLLRGSEVRLWDSSNPEAAVHPSVIQETRTPEMNPESNHKAQKKWTFFWWWFI